MKRIIKFRAFNKETKEFEPAYCDFDGWYYYDLDSGTKVYVQEVLEFTGLTDKNGKEIYEGDIVSNGNAVSIVRFRDGCFYGNRHIDEKKYDTDWDYLWKFLYRGNFEVIGNIYENPELIK